MATDNSKEATSWEGTGRELLAVLQKWPHNTSYRGSVHTYSPPQPHNQPIVPIPQIPLRGKSQEKKNLSPFLSGNGTKLHAKAVHVTVPLLLQSSQ